MNIIVCLDDNGGMLFNSRRQSQDKILRERISETAAGHKLWMNNYSAKLFDSAEIIADDSFLAKAENDDYCFIENADFSDYYSKISKIVIYKWNRVYPADTYFKMPLSEFTLAQAHEFKGSSHEKIIEEIYVK